MPSWHFMLIGKTLLILTICLYDLDSTRLKIQNLKEWTKENEYDYGKFSRWRRYGLRCLQLVSGGMYILSLVIK